MFLNFLFNFWNFLRRFIYIYQVILNLLNILFFGQIFLIFQEIKLFKISHLVLKYFYLLLGQLLFDMIFFLQIE
jgi:hypothetical protein